MTGVCHCEIAVMVCVGWKGVPPAHCPLPTACCLLPTAHCLLPAAHCPLPTVCCLLPTVRSSCVVACVSVWCVCCGLWNGGGGCVVSLLAFLFFPSSSSSSSSLSLVFGVVRAQLCEHARYPRTPLRLSCCLLCLVFSAPRPSSPSAFPVIVEWRCAIHHVSVCCVGMTAMGSLSRSSSFFW